MIGRDCNDFWAEAFMYWARFVTASIFRRIREGTIARNNGLEVGIDGRGYGIGARPRRTAGIFVIVGGQWWHGFAERLDIGR